MKIRHIFGGFAIALAILSTMTFGRFYGAERAMEQQAAYAARLNTTEVAMSQ
jgi:hypothetical protein